MTIESDTSVPPLEAVEADAVASLAHPDDVDTSAPEFWSDPTPFFAALREQCPVFKLPDEQGYIVSRFDDVKAASMKPEVYSSTRPIFGGGDPELEAIQAKGYPIVPTLTNNDPPEHTRFRKLVNRAFAPEVVRAIEPSIRDIANGIIDGWEGRTTVDFTKAFADVLPCYVMADWLGVSRADQPTFKSWSDDIVETIMVGPRLSRERQLECKHSYVDFQHYFADIIEKRRRDPGEDAVSHLVTARVGGERPLDVPEILDLLRAFLVAGNDTTANLLGGMLLLLIDHPETLAQVEADRLLVPNLVEESLRVISPAQWTMRTVLRDNEIGGCPVSGGERARMGWGSANRDATHFPDPDRFDIHRDASAHMAFGHGIHFCIGHQLARAEGRIGVEVLLDRLRDIRLAVPREQVRRKPVPGVNHLHSLPISFGYRGRAAVGRQQD
jgi:cytochrome P450